MILRFLFVLPGIVWTQNLYGPSQLDQYARLLNSGNIGGFGLFNHALQTGQVRNWADLSDPRYLPGLPPLPLTHDEVMAQLAATQPPPTTAATARPTPPTTPAPPMSNLYVGINPIPEMPPMAEERLLGKFDDDGVFHPDSEKEDEEKIIKRNHIQGTKIRDFSDPDRQKAPKDKDVVEKDEDYEKDENYDDPEIRVDSERPRKKKESSEEETTRETREPREGTQKAVTVDQSAVKQRRKVSQPRRPQFDAQPRQVQVLPSQRKGEEFDAPQRGPFQGQRPFQNNPVPQQIQPQRPQFQQGPIQQPQLYPTFVYRQKPAAAGRDAMLTNLLTEIEEYDDFLDQQHSYNEQFPKVAVHNPYRQLPDGQLPALQTTLPQLQTLAIPTQNSQFHQPAQTGFNPPQWQQQRAVQQAAPQHFPSTVTEHPLVNLFSLFHFPQNVHALAAPTLHIGEHKPSSTAAPMQATAQPIRTGGLVDIQQRPLQYNPLANMPTLPIFPGK